MYNVKCTMYNYELIIEKNYCVNLCNSCPYLTLTNADNKALHEIPVATSLRPSRENWEVEYRRYSSNW